MRSKPASRYGRRQLVSRSTEKLIQKKKFSLKVFFAKFFLFGATFFLAWFLFSGYCRIGEVKVFGVNDLVAYKVKNGIENYQANIVKRNFYLLVPGTLEAYLWKNLPELKEVSVEKNYQDKSLEIKAVLREVSYNWLSDAAYYTVDREGVVIGLEKKADAAITINDKSGKTYDIGDRAGNADLMLFIDKLNQNFGRTGAKIAEIEIKSVFQKELTVKTQAGYSVYLSTEREPVAQVNNLARILQETSKAGKKIEYVDLRIADRIFYK